MKIKGLREFTFLVSGGIADRIGSMLAIENQASLSEFGIDDLYLDTKSLVAEESGKTRRQRRYRIRRKGAAWNVFLDRTQDKSGVLSLRRSTVPTDELKRLDECGADESWQGNWFRKQTRSLGLESSLRICFQRTRVESICPGGNARLTIDRHIRVCDVRDCAGVEQWTDPSDLNVLRMTYFDVLPASFKAIVYDNTLLPESTCLYRKCVETIRRSGPVLRLNEGTPCQIG